MSYQVLARKWRPQFFEDLVGQEHVSQTLINAITADRVHHAFLFTGARGVGKTSAARIFAKALNCQEGPTTQPCGVCPSCLEITKGQGIDVLEIDGASNTGVDDIRELRENIRYLPSQSRYKIFIIDEVHMLSINAFNALLKTLEEPPAHAKFIFATTEPHKIPITILSRCQRFDFKKIGLVPLQARLRYIADQENIQIEDSGLTIIARSGGGSMRDALSTLDQVISFCGDRISDEELQSLLGLVSRSLLLAAIRAVLQRDAAQLLALVQKVDEHGHSFRQFCQQLVELVRALVVVKVVGQPGDLIDVGESELQEIKSLAEPAALEDLQRLLAILVRTEADLAISNYPRLTMEMVLVKLAGLPRGVEVATLIKRLEDLEKKLSPGLATAPVRKEPPVESVVAPPPADIPLAEEPPLDQSIAVSAAGSGDKDWAGLVDFVRNRRKPRISSLLEQSSVLLLELPRLRIGMPEMYFSLADGEMRQEIQILAAEYFAVEVKVEVEKVGNGEKAPLSLHAERAQQESDRKKKLRENAVEHPLVKSALNIFGGQIEDVKPIDKGFV
ncbi:DNA polymerase III subunit gamma/tau [uncultured Desulfuromusa sp.]|uniref:DNA polymerase III subunit gamma/tau n=1 Tax=uncultured Desulfuromusa sp. TaxID=219183 RepID=UPI002AA6C913|nr:DNA polymerase III subunit gamma/tau [uncultured Desulfuromusa sp.]